MVDDTPEARFLDDLAALTFAELADASGLSADEVRELLDEGLLAPAEGSESAFGARAIVVARAAYRVRREFALDDVHSVCVVAQLVLRIQALERELKSLRARTAVE